MTRHSHLTRQRDAFFDYGTAGNSNLRGQQRVPSHRHTVPDLHQVIDLGARADARFPDCRPIDRGVGTNFDVVLDDDIGALGNLEMRAVSFSREAETVAANDRAVVDDHATADPDALANGHVGMQNAVVADLRSSGDHDVRVNDGAVADRSTRTDDHERPNRNVSSDHRISGDAAGGIDAFRRTGRFAHEQAKRMSEGAIRVIAAQNGTRRLNVMIVGQNDGRGLCRLQQRLVARIGNECQVAGLRVLDAGDANDFDVIRSALEAAVQPFGDVTQFQ
jgi:hypothetical protein